MDKKPPAYYTLKRAAQQLGVHEQTLRSWERRGIIRMARLPRSGYRRVPVEEVERLQAEMAEDETRPGVTMHPPRTDAESQTQARVLAEDIRARMAGVDFGVPFEDFMQTQRGRMWLS